jgi:hypothetical protein
VAVKETVRRAACASQIQALQNIRNPCDEVRA